jgi:hypothetical protein
MFPMATSMGKPARTRGIGTCDSYSSKAHEDYEPRSRLKINLNKEASIVNRHRFQVCIAPDQDSETQPPI